MNLLELKRVFGKFNLPTYPRKALRRRCKIEWHSTHRVIRFSSESAPLWLLNSLWWTSRFDLLPAVLAFPAITPQHLLLESFVTVAVMVRPTYVR